MILNFRPLQKPWGQEITKVRRPRSTFKAPWSDTMTLLDRELSLLKASAVVLQIDVTEDMIRLDGLLRANTEPGFPGVRLIADTKVGTLSWQTDSCVWWRHNVRSIALGLEALRAVDRYGITEHGEQYKGWLAIEAGTPTVTPREVFAAVIGEGTDAADRSLTDRDLWRRARAAAHPDRNGGHRELWDQVEQAARQLGLEG